MQRRRGDLRHGAIIKMAYHRKRDEGPPVWREEAYRVSVKLECFHPCVLRPGRVKCVDACFRAAGWSPVPLQPRCPCVLIEVMPSPAQAHHHFPLVLNELLHMVHPPRPLAHNLGTQRKHAIVFYPYDSHGYSINPCDLHCPGTLGVGP